jgi:hypothetical protein
MRCARRWTVLSGTTCEQTLLAVATFSQYVDLVRSVYLVGVAGFEPTAPRSQSECATKLRHTPCTE